MLAFEQWWANATAIMGGDDSVDPLPLAWFLKAAKKGGKFVRLKVSGNEILLLDD